MRANCFSTKILSSINSIVVITNKPLAHIQRVRIFLSHGFQDRKIRLDFLISQKRKMRSRDVNKSSKAPSTQWLELEPRKAELPTSHVSGDRHNEDNSPMVTEAGIGLW